MAIVWVYAMVRVDPTLRLNFAFHNSGSTTQFLVAAGLRAELGSELGNDQFLHSPTHFPNLD